MGSEESSAVKEAEAHLPLEAFRLCFKEQDFEMRNTFPFP